MNWTASLLRNQLKKERVAHANQLNLLTNASLDAQNYLDLEEKVKILEANLKLSEEKLTKLKAEVKNTQKTSDSAIEEKETQLTKLAKKIAASKEWIFNLRKEVRTNSLYFQTELRKVGVDYSAKLAKQTEDLHSQIAFLKDSEADQQRELKERAKLITTLEQQQQESKSKVKQLEHRTEAFNKDLEPYFNQVLEVIKKNVILREKGKLKEAVAQIQELMEWKKTPLHTESNTPAGEPSGEQSTSAFNRGEEAPKASKANKGKGKGKNPLNPTVEEVSDSEDEDNKPK